MSSGTAVVCMSERGVTGVECPCPPVCEDIVSPHYLFCLTLIGKKVEVSLRLFDIFKRNMVFIFLLKS